MNALAEQGIGNDLAALIATAEDKWTRQVVEELEEEEFVEASWEHEGALVGA